MVGPAASRTSAAIATRGRGEVPHKTGIQQAEPLRLIGEGRRRAFRRWRGTAWRGRGRAGRGGDGTGRKSTTHGKGAWQTNDQHRIFKIVPVIVEKGKTKVLLLGQIHPREETVMAVSLKRSRVPLGS